MNFIELTTARGQKYLFDVISGWEIYDNDEKNQPALWANDIQGMNLSCLESYAEIKARLMPEVEVKRPVMRRVEYSKMEWVASTIRERAGQYVCVPQGEAWFHQFGLEIDEDCSQNYSVAILENDDGQVLTARADLIRLIVGSAA